MGKAAIGFCDPFAALLKQVQGLLYFAWPDKLQQAYLAPVTGRGILSGRDKNPQFVGGGRVGDQAGGQLGQDESRYPQGSQHGQAAFTRSQTAQERDQPAQQQDEKGEPGQGEGGKKPTLHHPGAPPQVKEVVGGGQSAKGSQHQRRQQRLAGVFTCTDRFFYARRLAAVDWLGILSDGRHRLARRPLVFEGLGDAYDTILRGINKVKWFCHVVGGKDGAFSLTRPHVRASSGLFVRCIYGRFCHLEGTVLPCGEIPETPCYLSA